MAESRFCSILEGNIARWLANPQELAHLVVRSPANVASEDLINRLFGIDYTPGLFWIAERQQRNPGFLMDEDLRDYQTWIAAIVNSNVLSLNELRTSNEKLDQHCVDLLVESVRTTLNLQLYGRPISESHTNQQADYVIGRIIRIFLTDDPDTQFRTQRRFNEAGRRIVLPITTRLEELDLNSLWRLSIDAGLIGADIKNQFPGMSISHCSLTNAIPLGSLDSPNSTQSIRQELLRRSTSPLAIDFRAEYYAEVLTPRQPCRLAWFTDDYLETLFDLKLLESQLRMKPDLHITLIPRDGYYGDASYDEVMDFLHSAAFQELNSFYEAGSFEICPEGPRTSSIDGRKLSQAAATRVDEADVVVVKGARSFETLQGLNRPTYFGLSVACSFSESLTGLDMELAEDVLVRQDPGMYTYSDFRFRSHRRDVTPDGRERGLARMTTLEYAAARRSAAYRELLSQFGDDPNTCNEWISEQSRVTGLTFAEVIHDRMNGRFL
jgi:uncharacterized protein with ATP-grasp and redox domains